MRNNYLFYSLCLLLALSGCSSLDLRDISSPIKDVMIRLNDPFSITHNKIKQTWPSGNYRLYSEDNDGVYFIAPRRFKGGIGMETGGLYYRKSDGLLKAWIHETSVFIAYTQDYVFYRIPYFIDYEFKNEKDSSSISMEDWQLLLLEAN